MKRFVVLTVAASMTLVGSTAFACLHKMKQADPETKMLVQAERDLDKGRYAAALKTARKLFPKLGAERVPTSVKGDQARKLRRAMTIASVVSVRTGGKLGPNGKTARKTKLQSINLTWASATLEKLSKSRSYDNKLKARWAEAMARTGNVAGALAVLDKLSQKDMMPDARSLATLAALKAATGDTKGRDAAVKLCKMRTSKKGACELPKVAQGTASKGNSVNVM